MLVDGIGVLLCRVFLELALDDNIVRRHLEAADIECRILRGPAVEGVAFLSRNGSDCNIGIEVVDISADYLSANLVGYVVLIDLEGSIKANVMRRHDELAGSSIDSYDIRDIRPAGKGIAFLFRMSGSYGYVRLNFIGLRGAKLSFDVLRVLIEVAYVERSLLPACVQIHAAHQERRRIRLLAFLVGIPAGELIVRTARELSELIIRNRIVDLAGLCGASFGNIRAKVRMVGDVNIYVLDVAVDMIAVSAVELYGVPDNLSNQRVVIGAEQRGNVGCRSEGLICGIIGISRAVPVGRGEETEVSRLNQIVRVNAIDIEFAPVSGLLACCGQTAFVTFLASCTHYAAVRSLIRQVICPTLACTALRLTTVRQKYEILSRGRGFRVDRGAVGSPLCVQRQVFVRHRGVGPRVVELCVGVPTVEDTVSLLNCRSGNRLIGPNRTCVGVRAFSARDFAAVQFVIQLHLLNVRLDINLDGSVVLGLAKIEAESVLAVFIGDSAQSQRVEYYAVDGVIGIIANLTDTNRRNLKGLVVPECPASNGLIGTVFVTVLDVNLIGYAAAITILCIFLVNRPVGNVDLNYLRIFSANQIVEYQMVGRQSEFSPLVRALGKVLKLAIPSMLAIRVSNAGNFGTELGLVIVRPGALMQYVLHASLPENGVVAAVRGCSVALIRHDIGDSKTVGIRDAFEVRGDFQRAGAVRNCAAVGNPVFSFNLLNVVQAISVDVQRCRANFIFRRIAYYIIVLRIVFRNVGRSVVIARLRAVRTAVCAAFRRSRCGILILGRLCPGLRRSGNSGSFGGVCCGRGINHRHCDFFVRRKKCDVLIVGQRPARAHGQHHDSRKSSCEQTFARILF